MDDLTPPHWDGPSVAHMQMLGRALRPKGWFDPSSDPCDEFEHERIRPAEPYGENVVRYRGWEAGWERLREYHTGSGYCAYRGGCDLGAPTESAGTWAGLLDAIDDAEEALTVASRDATC